MTILLAANAQTEDITTWRSELQAALPEERILPVDEVFDPSSIEIAFAANPPPGAMANLPSLKFIQSLWAGVDSLLADQTLPARIPIARLVDPAMAATMAETALLCVLAIHRRLFQYIRQQEERQWRQLPQVCAAEVGVLVLGMGRLGGACAHRLLRHGYRVAGWSTRPSELEGMKTYAGAAELPGALADVDVVVNLLPLTDATRGLLAKPMFDHMRPGAGLVNLARGAHVLERDLLDALDRDRLGHAVLDVFETEPLPSDHPFWDHPKVVVLPHVAALTDPRTASRVVAENVRAVRAGRTPVNLVDRARGY